MGNQGHRPLFSFWHADWPNAFTGGPSAHFLSSGLSAACGNHQSNARS
jgi:hypothetical protein